jgi:ribonuclease H2 subunit C
MELEEEEEEHEVKIMEEVGEFSEILAWGHEAVVDGDDIYVRSLEEWIGVAESVSSLLPVISLVAKKANNGG